MPRLAAAIIVLEKSPRWEAELKRRFDPHELLVRPCRTVRDVKDLSSKAPGSVVVADLSIGPADVLRLLETLLQQRSGCHPIVIGAADASPLEWPARDLGAQVWDTDRVTGAELSEHCRRLLNRSPVRINPA